MDINGDGTISIEEYIQSLQETAIQSEEDIKNAIKIFNKIDINLSGKIGYTGVIFIL
jgi:Ca2+-binding EF-hand superfamily protein